MQKLSRREEQVLTLFLQQPDVHSVAKALDVSVDTVRTHKAAAQRKLGLRNSIEIVLWGVKRGLVDPRKEEL